MALYQKFFQAAEIDMKAAKILTNENIFQPALYHLQQAYEKCVKSYYIFLECSNGISEREAYESCIKKLGHDTQESTNKLLQDLAQRDLDRCHKDLKMQTDPEAIDAIQTAIEAINRYKISTENMIRRHNLKANYQVNVRNYKLVIEGLYDYNRKIWNDIKSKLTTDKWYVLIDMSMGIIYPCFYRMEQVTRYPLTEFSYDNLDLLTNMKKPCEQIIEMLGDLFIQLKPLLNKHLS